MFNRKWADKCRIVRSLRWLRESHRKWSRLPRELLVIALVSAGVFEASRPVRGELPNLLADRAIQELQRILLAAGMPQAILTAGGFVGFGLAVLAMAMFVQSCGVLEYLFACEVDRRLNKQPLVRPRAVGIGLVITLVFSLASKGAVGLCATLLFVVLFSAVRLLKGGSFEISIHTYGRNRNAGPGPPTPPGRDVAGTEVVRGRG